jgi:hypothetical protein
VTTDEVYGQHRGFRDWLATTQPGALRAGHPQRRHDAAVGQAAPTGPVAGHTKFPAPAWERRSAGRGAHGPRLYDWATVALDPAGLPPGVEPLAAPPPPDHHRRHHCAAGLYRCAGPSSTTVAPADAGGRDALGDRGMLSTAKNEAELDHYQVRGHPFAAHGGMECCDRCGRSGGQSEGRPRQGGS